MLAATLAKLPLWYAVLAAVCSLYYGVRGVVGQRIAALQLNQSLAAQSLRQWQAWEVVFVRYIQDFVFHVVCALAGFLCLFLSVAALQEFKSLVEVPAGAAVLIVFSFLLGLVGVCGQLPLLLLEGRFPKAG